MCHSEIYVVSLCCYYLSTGLCHLTVMARERTGRKLLTALKRIKYFLAFMTPCPCTRSPMAAAGKLLHWLCLSACVCAKAPCSQGEPSIPSTKHSVFVHLTLSLIWREVPPHDGKTLNFCIKEVKLILLLGPL